MTLALIGVNHKTAPIELRERIAIARGDLAEATRALASAPGVTECMIVSTCNRVEMLASVDSPDADLTAFLHRHFGLDPALLAPHVYEHRDRDAVRHLFRVAASLDSMVVGESQILGQLKEAFAVARESGHRPGQLDHLLQAAFAAAKKVRSETEIGVPFRIHRFSCCRSGKAHLWIAEWANGFSGRRGQNERAGRAASGRAGGGGNSGDQPD